MKKILLLAFLITYSNILISQTTISAIGGDWDNTGSWETNSCDNGYPGSLNDPTGQTACPDIIIIPEGVTIAINSGDDIYYDGELRVYGSIIFRRGNGAGDVSSSIIMNDASVIKIAPSGTLSAVNPGGSEAGNADDNFITIGTGTITGSNINNLQSPNQITETTITDPNNPGGCAETGTCNSDPLPIELKSFEASKSGKNISLNWVTAKEDNFSHFEIERSVDQNNWNQIGLVQGMGESMSDVYYDFTDRNAPFGKIYYRLKSVDIDATFEYSPVVKIEVGFEGKLAVSPNPVKDASNLKIQVPSEFRENLAYVGLFDLSGVKVQEFRNFNTDGNLQINQKLKSGMYILKVNHNGLQENIRVIIQ